MDDSYVCRIKSSESHEQLSSDQGLRLKRNLNSVVFSAVQQALAPTTGGCGFGGERGAFRGVYGSQHRAECRGHGITRFALRPHACRVSHDDDDGDDDDDDDVLDHHHHRHHYHYHSVVFTDHNIALNAGGMALRDSLFVRTLVE
jgi:hypothetical protein